MDTLPEGKSRTDLKIEGNKDIPIKCILGISIRNFRTLKAQTLILGGNVTVLSGRNGTMKTSLMGLLAHPFSSEAKDAFGSDLKTPLQQVFKLSPEFDTEDYTYDMKLQTANGDVVSEAVSIYRVAQNTNRHRVVVSGASKGDGNFTYNTSFLNLKRLFPLVDTQAAPTTDSKISLTAEEAGDLKDFYETIFPSSEYESFIPIHQNKVKTTFALAGSSARYDWHSISSGEDNLGAIFNRLIGFQRSYKPGNKCGNGILCIDEFESSLHPVAQLKLLDYLYRWSEKYKVQVVISTHSLHLIQHLYLSHSPNLLANRIVINFISKSTAKGDNFPILKNPDYNLAYKELTFTKPEEIAAARKLKIFCEDEYAVHFAKRLIKTQTILSTVEFHSSTDPDGGKIGTSWTALRKLCVEYPLLLEGALALFDADVGQDELSKIKYQHLYLVLPDEESLAIERRIIAFIIGLKNDDHFFEYFNKERDIFLNEFKTAQIRSLSLADVKNPEKTSIIRCKAWADSDKKSFKKYITYYADRSGLSEKFRTKFIERLNKINRQYGLPLIS